MGTTTPVRIILAKVGLDGHDRGIKGRRRRLPKRSEIPCATFNTKSLLGGALPGQKKYADAEPLLRAGYEGMKQREKTIPPPGQVYLPEAIERLVQLYEATAKKDEDAKWRKELNSAKIEQERMSKPPKSSSK